ncbi:MAG: hypothetical protein JW891_10555 [Candidatus Lokiarchaeota archaeon]|nr:hypothetical protein [Candidatus Lokiarchaeota archaeon]
MENERYESRALLSRLLTICPQCKKHIYGKDLNLSEIDKSTVRSWPMPYVYCHLGEKGTIHALTMYLDASFTVRAREVSEHVSIQENTRNKKESSLI